MNALLEQFLSEARDALQGIGEKLMRLEEVPQDADLMNELFRLVHTLKGNSGLFDFPEMTRVLHASEDLMSVVRNGKLGYSRNLADHLMDAMDFVSRLCDGIEAGHQTEAAMAEDSIRLAESLRQLIPLDERKSTANPHEPVSTEALATDVEQSKRKNEDPAIAAIPEAVRMDAFRQALSGRSLHLVDYRPSEDCFFQGADPLHTVLNCPERLWGRILSHGTWPALAELNTYSCALDFQLLSSAPRVAIAEHFRYVMDQVTITAVLPFALVLPVGIPEGGLADGDFVTDALFQLKDGNFDALRAASKAMVELLAPETLSASVLRWMLILAETLPESAAAISVLIGSLATRKESRLIKAGKSMVEAGLPAGASPSKRVWTETELALRDSIFGVQRQILLLADRPAWYMGRLFSVAEVLANCCEASGETEVRGEIMATLSKSIDGNDHAPLLEWLDLRQGRTPVPSGTPATGAAMAGAAVTGCAEAEPPAESRVFGRRVDDSIVAAKSLKVDQAKIDRLMDLIGEMIVSKNALPYLAQRAETQYGMRELSREIKAQYAVINRISQEMQDAIMQVRMLPVSFVFQRFPRLVREISRKLGKEVRLDLIGEGTEIDKNIIEALADPLIHIVRNSLDHGLELPEARIAAGKNATGTLTLRASQDADRVNIEISDDGKGIDPAVMKRKAYEKGFIDETTMERMTDREAINLVFAAGLSTVDVVSDLSGRGVGMDVVRSAVDKCNGTIELLSEIGMGTTIRISLPLSMAVTEVMIVESDGQLFGVPMDHVVETVRISRKSILSIKHSQTTTLRGRAVPLKSLNTLLGLSSEPLVNDQDEVAVLVAQVGADVVGLLVDDFRETVGIIQKPLEGALGRLSAYSGSAIIGDGSVLMVLNIKGVL